MIITQDTLTSGRMLPNLEFLIVVSLVQVNVVTGVWVNVYDGHLHFECASQKQFISHVTSVHDNGPEDRVFEMSCSNFAVDVSAHDASCYWTGYLNSHDGLLAYECSDNRYVSGMQSDHSNHHEDRVWKLKCCKMNDIHLADCHFTSWTNGWDGRQYFHTGSTYVMKGVVSIHSNSKEDRLYKYEVCKVFKNDGSALVGRRLVNQN